jgi:hypothetical protein
LALNAVNHRQSGRAEEDRQPANSMEVFYVSMDACRRNCDPDLRFVFRRAR